LEERIIRGRHQQHLSTKAARFEPIEHQPPALPAAEAIHQNQAQALVAIALPIIGPRLQRHRHQGGAAKSAAMVIHPNTQHRLLTNSAENHRRLAIFEGIINQIT
jgi:hypothetical protein